MMRKACALLVLIPVALLWQSAPAGSPRPSAGPGGNRIVYYGTGLTDEDALVFSSAVAGADPWAVLLMDGPNVGKAAAPFLAALRPRSVVPAGPGAGAVDELSERLGIKVAAPLTWKSGSPTALWKSLFPKLAARRRRSAPSRAACCCIPPAWRAALHAPLYVFHGREGEPAELRERLTAWNAKEVYAIGGTAGSLAQPDDLRLVPLADEAAVAAAYLRELAKSRAGAERRRYQCCRYDPREGWDVGTGAVDRRPAPRGPRPDQ